MPKNKGKFHSGAGEKELPPEEQIRSLAERWIEVVRPHAVKIAAVVGGVALILAALSIWTWATNRKAARASNAFRDVVAKLETPVEGELPDFQRPPDPDAPKFKTHQERAEAALAEMKELESSYGSTDVAQSALLVKGGVLYDLARYDEAIQTYRAFLKGSAAPQLVLLAREGIGYALEAKALAQTDAAARAAGLDQALEAYKEIQRDEKRPGADVALYHQARILALKGDKAGATALYRKALDAAPASPLVDEINGRLALLGVDPAAAKAPNAPAAAPSAPGSPR